MTQEIQKKINFESGELLNEITLFLSKKFWVGDELGDGSYKDVYQSGLLGKNNRVVAVWDTTERPKTNGQLKFFEIPCSFFVAKNRYETPGVDISKFYPLKDLASWASEQNIETIRENFPRIAYSILSGVYELYLYYIAHGDLKPENIFLSVDKDQRICASIGDHDGDRYMDEKGRGVAGIFTPQYALYPVQMGNQATVSLHKNDIHAIIIILLNLYFNNENATFEAQAPLKRAYMAWYDCEKDKQSYYMACVRQALNGVLGAIKEDIKNISDENIKQFFEKMMKCAKLERLETALSANYFDSIRDEMLSLDVYEKNKQRDYEAYFEENNHAPLPDLIYAYPRSVQILFTEAKKLIESIDEQLQHSDDNVQNLLIAVDDWLNNANDSIKKFPDDDFSALLIKLSSAMKAGCNQLDESVMTRFVM